MKKYSLKEVMQQPRRMELRDKKGFWNWVKHKLSMKVEQELVEISPLEEIADIICQTNDLMKVEPFYYGNKPNNMGII